MANSNSGIPAIQYSSYADYVVSIYGDGSDVYSEQAWLVGFLRWGYPERYWKQRPAEIKIHILDSVNDILESQTFTAPRRGPVDPAFLKTLQSSPSQRRTRLIMVQCGQLGDTNGLYIDAIGLRYMLDPHFFSAHFDICLDLTEGGKPNRNFQPALLPSERQFLQIVTDLNSHLTVAWKISENECTCK